MSGIDKKTVFRFGIMANGDVLKQWQINAVRRLIGKGHIPVVVIVNKTKGQEGRRSKIKKYLGKNAVYNFYVRFFQRVDNLENIEWKKYVSDVEIIEAVTERKGKFSEYFLGSDVEKIKNLNLDFILRFGFNIIKGEILESARYGVWSFHHDDEQVIRGGPPGFWEIFHSHNVNGIILQRLTETLDGGLIIRKGFFPVISHSYSAHLNELLNYGVDILEFAVDNLSADEEITFKSVQNKNVKLYRFSGNFAMLGFLLKVLKNRIVFNVKDLFLHENWNIGVAGQTAGELVKSGEFGNVVFAPENSNNKFRADVFGLECNAGLRLFFEDFDYGNYKGVISSVLFNRDEKSFQNDEKVIISKPYHLAFPFVFNYESVKYLIPETSVTGTTKAFMLSGDFLKTEKEIEVSDFGCVDPVIFRYNEYYWMFCTRKEYGTNINLFAFYSEKPFGPWQPHRLNPVISDVRKARMAGNFFFDADRLIRPAQKNNITYGESIVLHEVTELTPDVYAENEIAVLKPDNLPMYNKGVHTISVIGDFVAFDAKNYKFVWSGFVRKLKSKFEK